MTTRQAGPSEGARKFRQQDIEFAHELVHAGHRRGDITPGLPWKRGVSRDAVVRILGELRFRLDATVLGSGEVRWVAVAS